MYINVSRNSKKKDTERKKNKLYSTVNYCVYRRRIGGRIYVRKVLCFWFCQLDYLLAREKIIYKTTTIKSSK